MIIKKYIYTFIGFLFLGMALSIYFLWNNNCSLREEKVKIELELSETQIKLNNVINIKNKIQEYNIELAKTVDTYRLKTQDLQSKLSKFELKANSISQKHPKLLSNAINKATKDVNECFEKISKGMECENTD